MRIVQRAGWSQAAACRGHVVVIDVIRAFSTAAYAFGAGAASVVVVGTPEEAFDERERRPGAVLVGESGGRRVPGFDHGNSPAALARADLAGRPVILRSGCGTQGVVRATSADAIYLGSLVVAAATVALLRARDPDLVTLLASASPGGPEGGPDGPEDVACSDYLAALLRGEDPDPAEVVRLVRASPAAAEASDPALPWISVADLDRATEVDRFGFAMPAAWDGRRHVAHKRTP